MLPEAGEHPDATAVRAGHDMGVRDHVAVGNEDPTAGRLEAAGGGPNAQGAGLGRRRDRAGALVGGPFDRRKRQRFEPDEDLGQSGRVQQGAEVGSDLGGRWQQGVEAPDGRGCLGRLGQARHRTDRQQAAGEPDDQQGLGGPHEPARDPVRGPQDAGSEGTRDAAAEGGPDRLSDADRDEESGDHHEGADRRVEFTEWIGEGRQGEDREGATTDGAQQPSRPAAALPTGSPAGSRGPPAGWR